MVGVFVDADGQPEEVKVIESSGHDVLDSAAYRFAKALTFDPAIVDDAAVSSWTKLILRYKLTEVPFEKNQWLQDVLKYQKILNTASDTTEINTYQRKLYTRFIGLSTYVNRYNNIEINSTIDKVITDYSRKRWANFFDVMAAPFIVYDDFLYRYPQASLTSKIKEDLVRQLIEAEGELRLQILQGKRTFPNYNKLLDVLKNRLDELQADNSLLVPFPSL